MIFRIFPEKDTFITNKKSGLGGVTPQTGSNFGASEILEVSKETGVSGSSGFAASASISRMMFQFDLSQIAQLTASSNAPTTGATYSFKLFDAQHMGQLPSSFDIEVLPLSRQWDEGNGIDLDSFSDHGVANWDKSQTTVLWTAQGGDTVSSSTSSYHFDTGHENVEVDITPIVGAWLTGGLPNYGLMVKLTDTEEADGNDYYTKKFHARNTHYNDKRPTIEMKWDDSVKDNRGTFLFGVPSSLFLYNKQRGQLTDITGVGTGNDVITVDIADLSGTIQTFSASHTGVTGIYSASITLASGSYSGSLFSDKWGLNGASYMTGTFVPHNDGAEQVNDQEEYIVKIMNKKKEYELADVVKFNLFVRTRGYNPAVVQTGSLVMHNTVIEKGYYRIDNATTGEHVIPLGTGSVETTRLSYDKDGNYFKFYMSSLATQEVYKVVFFFEVDGQLQRLDESIKFKVI